MSRLLKAPLFGAVCGMMLFAAPSNAAIVSGGLGSDAGASALVQQIVQSTAPEGKKCLKYNRRFNTAHGFGHRRCIHWK
jgi:hypothetical protein